MPAFWWFAALGCTDPIAEIPQSVQSFPEAGTRVVAVPERGSAPLSVRLQAVNSWGVASGPAELTVEVDGEPVVVNFDSTGWSSIELEDLGVHQVGDAEVVVLPAWDIPLQRSEESKGENQFLQPMTDFWLVGASDRLWGWKAGLSPVPVYEPPVGDEIHGVWTGFLERDGLRDALVWTEDAVVAFRGTADGGAFGLSSWSFAGKTVSGAGADDLDGDGIIDLAIAWSDDEDPRLEVWRGLGSGAFELWESRQMEFKPQSMAIGDSLGMGLPQITVINETHQWTRYVWSDSGFMEVGPTLDFVLPVSTVSSPGDMNGDGANELVFVTEVSDEEEFPEVSIFDLDWSSAGLVDFDIDYAGVTVADVNSDGAWEFWSLDQEGDLGVVDYGDDGYHQGASGNFPQAGLLGLWDQTGDDFADMMIAGDYWMNWTGAGGPDWVAVATPWIQPELTVTGPIAAHGAQLVGFVQDTNLHLRGWESVGSAPTVAWDVDLLAPMTAVDMAICGERAWVLTDTSLFVVDLDGGSIAGPAVGTGTRVDCAEDQGVVLDGDTARRYDAAAQLTDSEAAAGAGDVAIIGDDLGTVLACDGADCDVVSWASGWAVAENGRTRVTIDGEERDVGPAGELSVGDVDGNGELDLIVRAGSNVGVLRAIQGSLSAPDWFHFRESAAGAVQVVTGAAPELWLADGANGLRGVVAEGG